MEQWDYTPPDNECCEAGVIFAMATVHSVERSTGKKWETGPWCWRLKNIKKIDPMKWFTVREPFQFRPGYNLDELRSRYMDGEKLKEETKPLSGYEFVDDLVITGLDLETTGFGKDGRARARHS